MTRKADREILDDTLWTPRETAEKLKTSQKTIYRLMERGELAYTMVGRQRRILESELAAYLHGGRRGPSIGPMLRHGLGHRSNRQFS